MALRDAVECSGGAGGTAGGEYSQARGNEERTPKCLGEPERYDGKTYRDLQPSLNRAVGAHSGRCDYCCCCLWQREEAQHFHLLELFFRRNLPYPGKEGLGKPLRTVQGNAVYRGAAPPRSRFSTRRRASCCGMPIL